MEASTSSRRDDDPRPDLQANGSRAGTPPNEGGSSTRSTPPQLKARPRSQRITDADEQAQLAGQLPPSQPHVRSWLPPIPHLAVSDYVVQHHTLKPSFRASSSAYVKRHHASRGMLPGQARSEMLRNDELPGRPGPQVRHAILAALAVNAELLPARVEREPAIEAAQMQWSTTSVGDLEALDSILDMLVVKDFAMREALLRGPLISFETVVPDPEARTRPTFQYDAEYKDETFITGVKGVEEAQQQEEAEASAATEPEPAPVAEPTPLAPELRETQRSVVAEMPAYSRPVVSEDHDLLREGIPIPILPKLARAYITHKPSVAVKVPPLPPPTAEYLIKSRPAAVIAAPSYDELCTQIRDVQRQYTCGTAKDRLVSAGATLQSNTNMYISGLDGPNLDDMVNYDEVSLGLERSRPSFVALKKNSARTVKTGRSASRERSARHSGAGAGVGASSGPWDQTGERG